jgi:hypothetical protein
MILNVKKSSCHQIPMIFDGPFGITKIHHMALWRNLGDLEKYANINFDHPLWTFILNGSRLWHMV